MIGDLFKTIKLGCFFSSLLMMIPTVLAIVVLLVGASALGMLPSSINDPVVGGERFVAQQFINSDLGGSKLSVRSITVTPAATPGHANLALAVNSSSALPKDVRPLAVIAFASVAKHLGMPFGLAADSIDTATVALYGPGATAPSVSVSVSRAVLDQYSAGTISQATFMSDMSVK
jgi:hypothetical protein